MKKIAIIFPGVGYTADRPLLHYSRRLAAAHGYEARILDYKGFPQGIRGDRARMKEAFVLAMEQAREMLQDTDLADYEDIVFIGKSIGTIVASKIASESPVRDRIRFVLYTPLEETFVGAKGAGIAFTGDDDPWTGREKTRIPALCKERGIPCMVFPGANHSLETSDVFADMKALCRIMQETERFLLNEDPGRDIC